MSDDLLGRAKAALDGVDDGPWRVLGYGNIQSAVTRPRVGKVTRVANAEFVAQARSLVPELVDEVEQLRARNKALSGNIDQVNQYFKAWDAGELPAHKALEGIYSALGRTE